MMLKEDVYAHVRAVCRGGVYLEDKKNQVGR